MTFDEILDFDEERLQENPDLRLKEYPTLRFGAKVARVC